VVAEKQDGPLGSGPFVVESGSLIPDLVAPVEVRQKLGALCLAQQETENDKPTHYGTGRSKQDSGHCVDMIVHCFPS
jgi:hypothetical protein